MNDGEEKRTSHGGYEQRRPPSQARPICGTLWYVFHSPLSSFTSIIEFADSFEDLLIDCFVMVCSVQWLFSSL